jgi:acyl-CoA dehydrogenase
VARTDPNRRHGLGLFLVERGMEGFKRGRNLKKMGLKAQDTSELFFTDVKVPKSQRARRARQRAFISSRTSSRRSADHACGAMTLCQVAFDATLQFVKERKAFGQPIGTFQVSRFKMADMRAQIDADAVLRRSSA